MKSASAPKKSYEQLVEAAEIEIQRHPKRYYLKIALLAMGGYVFIFGLLLLSLSIFGFLFFVAVVKNPLPLLLIKSTLLLGLLGIEFFLISALWIRFEEPTGYRLDKKKYPILFAELNQLRKKLKAPAIHQVILQTGYNAAISTRPRFGILGWNKTTLCLGLELLMGMSPQQATAVFAHELSHLSGKGCGFSSWLCRVRNRWQNISVGLEHQGKFKAAIVRKFFNWYTPIYSAYSLTLARANEYSADQDAAKITSTEVLANALVNSHVMPGFLEQYFWQPFRKPADYERVPPCLPYGKLMSFLQNSAFEPTMIEAAIGQAMAIRTGHFDTHPALKDRLAALKWQVTQLEPTNDSAAQVWLGKLLPSIVRHFDKQWIELNGSKWSERYQYFQQGCLKLAELKNKDIDSLSSAELWQLASLTKEFGENDACLNLFQLYKIREPKDFNADYAIGRFLLSKNDESGVEILLEVMKYHQHMASPICETLANFYWGLNDPTAAYYWREQLEIQWELLSKAQEERKTIASIDELITPDTHSDEYFQVVEQIKQVKGAKHIWLVEKKMNFLPGWKTYIIAFENGMTYGETNAIQLIGSQLKLNSCSFVIMRDGYLSGIAEKVIKTGIQVF
jgi:Zn-dependent protease with chaperone function